MQVILICVVSKFLDILVIAYPSLHMQIVEYFYRLQYYRRSCFLTVTSKWARWRLKSPVSRMFTQPFIRRSKKTSKLRVTGLCEGTSPVTGEGPVTWKCFHLMASSCADLFLIRKSYMGLVESVFDNVLQYNQTLYSKIDPTIDSKGTLQSSAARGSYGVSLWIF